VLTLLRDRVGEKPLYYGWSRGRFLFGSELSAFTAAGDFEPAINRTALDQLVRRLYIPSPFSIYQDVFKLLPGALLRISPAAAETRPSEFSGLPSSLPGLELIRYWSYREIADEAHYNQIHNAAAASAELERLMIRSVGEQAIADVPVGTFLSGGIDSSTVVALQQRHSGSRVRTFTIGFDEPGFDESVHARAVAEHLGTEHQEFRVTAGDALALVPALPQIYDEPFADSSQIPTHILSRAAHSKVTVALSGDGGDELFGGYGRYRSIRNTARLRSKLPQPARRSVARIIDALGPSRIDRLAHLLRVERLVKGAGNRAQRTADVLRCLELSALYSVLLSQWNPSAKVVLGADEVDWPDQMVSHRDPAAQMMQWDLLSYLPDDLLCKVDRAAMATSLETRAPFLDHRVVEFSSRVPVSMKLGPDGGKWLLRQLLYKYVPRVIVDRPKAGFSIPLAHWLRGPLRDWAEALLAPAELRAQGYFNPLIVARHWRAHVRGERDYSAALWPVLMFQAWLEHQGTTPSRFTTTQQMASR
jgi:asparagine synthase (glutamine-hydrolysing)